MKKAILRVIVVPKSFSKRVVVDFQLRNLWGKKNASIRRRIHVLMHCVCCVTLSLYVCPLLEFEILFLLDFHSNPLSCPLFCNINVKESHSTHSEFSLCLWLILSQINDVDVVSGGNICADTSCPYIGVLVRCDGDELRLCEGESLDSSRLAGVLCPILVHFHHMEPGLVLVERLENHHLEIQRKENSVRLRMDE